jgi:hypothetical protein
MWIILARQIGKEIENSRPQINEITILSIFWNIISHFKQSNKEHNLRFQVINIALSFGGEIF